MTLIAWIDTTKRSGNEARMLVRRKRRATHCIHHNGLTVCEYMPPVLLHSGTHLSYDIDSVLFNRVLIKLQYTMNSHISLKSLIDLKVSVTASMVTRRFLAGSRWVVTCDLLGTTSQGFTLDSWSCLKHLCSSVM